MTGLGQPTSLASPGRPDASGSEAMTLGLGLDVGGSHTRWALARPDGALLAEGQLPGFSGAQAGSAAGQAHVRTVLGQLADALHAAVPPGAVLAGAQAGVSGFDPLAQHGGQGLHALMVQALAPALALAADTLHCHNDLELAYRLHFAPGQGYVLYAGTGSIAAFVDAQGRFERAGGRGLVLGDEGGGAWIGVQALAAVWRAEDSEPGAWRRSTLAQALFARLGDEDWSTSRQFVHRSGRGDWGLLAVAVGEAAQAGDAQALALLEQAGQHLAQLAQALARRFGPRPLALAGRAWLLHPAIEQTLRHTLGSGWVCHHVQMNVAAAAARWAAGAALPSPV